MCPRLSGGTPHRIVRVQAHEPAKQQVVVELFHEQPLAAYAVEHLKKQGSKQTLRWNRRPSFTRVNPTKRRRHVLQYDVDHLSNGSQRMTCRHPLVRRNRAPHRALLTVATTHRSFPPSSGTNRTDESF